ncbi:hypothetical protein HanHA300_Chr04g0142601 [Helianthus annuus]|nr:hypothetical protein HanHA300_Chr04g0142581 [Helianthus annuus]KAJ0581577.1 hypothetical protein HanHA300_Chr04g0142601 [Helianthus annuus]KAJ0597539.1 hypothetical protein HanHA89_Chr04g0155741 [Helianthus annuus]KAJ0597541.1 hypothetical protein HanHA89_Chr04g0155761 [Helianthus annuus]
MTNLKPCCTNPLASAESKLASKPGLSKYKHKHTRVHRLTQLVLMQMKVSVTSTMFTNLTCKLSKCVCEFRTECSQSYLSEVCVLSVCLVNSTQCMGIYTHTQQVMSEGSDRWSEGSSIDDNMFE